MDGSDAMVVVGLAAALAAGMAIGAANYLLIWALRIPPIIATLSAGFIILSIDISYGRGLQIKPPPGFAEFANIQLLGVPILAILTVLFTIGASIALQRMVNVDIGNEYLLASIAVVVIGGTSVAGGKANVPGLWGAALFLVLLLTMLNTFGVSAGVRLVLTGLIIVGVITAAGGQKALR
jgi:ribose transport system permease protein